jgi:hypothetical protein
VEGCEPFQRFPPVGSQLRVKVAAGKHGGHGASLPLVVIDDEDPARNRRLSKHNESYPAFLQFTATIATLVWMSRKQFGLEWMFSAPKGLKQLCRLPARNTHLPRV